MYENPFTNSAFEKHLAEHRLMGSRCEACGELFAPPRPICTACGSEKMEWIPLSGEGSLVAYTIITIGPKAMIAAGYNRENPYCSGIVRLAEGPMVSAQIVGVDPKKPTSITVGAPLKVAFIERNGAAPGGEPQAKTVLAFEPA